MSYYGLTGGCEHGLVYPVSPITFAAGDGLDNESLVLTWDETDMDAEYVEIEMSTSDANYVALITLGPLATPGEQTYTVTGLEADTAYYFRLRSFKRGKWSDAALIKANHTTTNV